MNALVHGERSFAGKCILKDKVLLCSVHLRPALKARLILHQEILLLMIRRSWRLVMLSETVLSGVFVSCSRGRELKCINIPPEHNQLNLHLCLWSPTLDHSPPGPSDSSVSPATCREATNRRRWWRWWGWSCRWSWRPWLLLLFQKLSDSL